MSNEVLLKADLELLVSRMRWPIPAVRWWVIQELAGLLVHKDFTTQLESALFRELEGCMLESEVVEWLFVFWVASRGGYVPNVDLWKHIKARSALSMLILEDLGLHGTSEGAFSALPLEVGPGYMASDEFQREQGRFVPTIFHTLCKSLEEQTGLPFSAQHAFEWERTASVSAAVGGSDIGYFYGRPVEEMRGQFVTSQALRGRSAYLRTLNVAQEIWRAPAGIMAEYAVVALPLDPTLARLRPHRPEWIPSFPGEGPTDANALESHVRNVLSKLKEHEPASLFMSFSEPLRVTENEVVDLEVFAWAQWEERHVDANALLKETATRQETRSHGWVEALKFGESMVTPAQELKHLMDDAMMAAPCAGEVGMWRRGYLHSDLYSRGIVMPYSTVAANEVVARPNGGELEFSIASMEVGRWLYWNVDWTTYYHQKTRAHVGAALLGSRSAMSLLWERRPVRFFYLWRCTRLSRKQSYEHFSSDEVSGVIIDEMSTTQNKNEDAD